MNVDYQQGQIKIKEFKVTTMIILKNGRFFTGTVAGGRLVEPAGWTFANTMIIHDDLITHVGEEGDAEISQARQTGAEEIDLKNRIVLPGFIDGHMHLLLFGSSLAKVSLDWCKDLDEIRATIKKFAESNPDVPRILCSGWMHSATRAEGEVRASMLDDLDSRPIYIDAKDLHSVWSNTPALSEMGVQSLSDPVGGVIHRDETGRASGLLSEAAANQLVWPFLAKAASMEEKLRVTREAIRVYSQAGYTGMVEMAMDENAWETLLLMKDQEPGILPMRIACHWLITPKDTHEGNLEQVERAIALHKQYNAENSPNFRIAGIKIICDGVVDACTAALREPYSSNGIHCDTLWLPEMLDPVVQRADQAGLQCALHAIGDQAIKMAVDALERVSGPNRRHRIEHLELTSPEDAIRLGKLGITASIQPVHSDPAIFGAWPKLIGEHRCGRAFAYKEFLDSGATLAIGTDAPTAAHMPLPNFYTATTRRSAMEPESEATVNEHFALGIASTVVAATAGAAYSCFADGWTGSLRKGLKADFVVLDVEWKAETLLKGVVRETWFDGKKVFGA
jgi:predicted amidohydrolase YtcJ